MRTRFITVTGLLIAQCCAPIRAGAQQSTRETRDLPSSSSIFKEVAEEVGLRFQHYNGTTGKLFLPEIMGSGAALFDFDNDGDLDVFLVQGNVLEPASNPGDTLFPWRGSESPRGRLFRNDLVVAKDGSRTLKFTDVTDKSGIVATGYGMGAAAFNPLFDRLIKSIGYSDTFFWTGITHGALIVLAGLVLINPPST